MKILINNYYNFEDFVSSYKSFFKEKFSRLKGIYRDEYFQNLRTWFRLSQKLKHAFPDVQFILDLERAKLDFYRPTKYECVSCGALFEKRNSLKMHLEKNNKCRKAFLDFITVVS